MQRDKCEGAEVFEGILQYLRFVVGVQRRFLKFWLLLVPIFFGAFLLMATVLYFQDNLSYQTYDSNGNLIGEGNFKK
ncbi:hypothetical protein [Thalassococcus lentus]|uniref:Uncharacterized protein n=1 Tax=Thalassococcus lentus TaxID=1210524 RepID=A0ABT4XWR8_9RHOB|nr:hypothetical protein [Thalassococcus lentus]MDA7426399.1 hypothetical protein [Thalassococcus lentus]